MLATLDSVGMWKWQAGSTYHTGTRPIVERSLVGSRQSVRTFEKRKPSDDLTDQGDGVEATKPDLCWDDWQAIETVSLTQKTDALSSAKADLYASNRAAVGTLQTRHFMEEAGCAVPARVWSDSSEGFGIIRRTGCGPLKCIDIRWLWVQDARRERRFLLKTLVCTDSIEDKGATLNSTDSLEYRTTLFSLTRIP